MTVIVDPDPRTTLSDVTSSRRLRPLPRHPQGHPRRPLRRHRRRRLASTPPTASAGLAFARHSPPSTLLELHAEHEDTFIDPAFAPHLPDVAARDRHRPPMLSTVARGDRRARPLRRRRHAPPISAACALASTSTWRLHLRVPAHQELEEREVMPALERAIGLEACWLSTAIVGSIPPDGDGAVAHADAAGDEHRRPHRAAGRHAGWRAARGVRRRVEPGRRSVPAADFAHLPAVSALRTHCAPVCSHHPGRSAVRLPDRRWLGGGGHRPGPSVWGHRRRWLGGGRDRDRRGGGPRDREGRDVVGAWVCGGAVVAAGSAVVVVILGDVVENREEWAPLGRRLLDGLLDGRRRGAPAPASAGRGRRSRRAAHRAIVAAPSHGASLLSTFLDGLRATLRQIPVHDDPAQGGPETVQERRQARLSPWLAPRRSPGQRPR